MKKIYIIHGWGGSPNEPALKWLAGELRKDGFEVVVPEMPDADTPKIEVWVPYLQDLMGVPDEGVILVGHSIGCQAILRFLETLPENTRIGGAIFIAGWYDVRNLETEEERQVVAPWVNNPRDDEKIRRAVNKAIVILSDNDPFVALENKSHWENKVGAEVRIEHDKGHFTLDDGVYNLPTAVEAIEELSNS